MTRSYLSTLAVLFKQSMAGAGISTPRKSITPAKAYCLETESDRDRDLEEEKGRGRSISAFGVDYRFNANSTLKKRPQLTIQPHQRVARRQM